MIDISYNDTQIIIEPHRQTYVCAITGKISTEAVKIGEAWISWFKSSWDHNLDA